MASHAFIEYGVSIVSINGFATFPSMAAMMAQANIFRNLMQTETEMKFI
jgi:hypothetical protein